MEINNKYCYNLGLRFREIVKNYGHRDALVYPNKKTISYSELNKLATRVASIFKQKSLQNGDLVLLSGDKSPEMFSSILACLQCGIVYSIYDPEGPTERLERMVKVCRPKMILKSENDLHQIKEKNKVIEVLDYTQLLLISPSGNDMTEVSLEDVIGSQLAYIMFTSGSSGTPKGAMMTHSNVMSLIDWSLETFSFGPGEILTNVNASYFDNFVFDFYSALFSGASLVPFTRADIMNPMGLLNAIEELGCTTWFSVPTMLIYLQSMRALNRSSMSKVKRIIFGGEGYPKAQLFELFKLFKQRIDFFNVYGPTECTCICSSYRVTQKDFLELEGFLPLGRLIPNFGYYILDDNLQLVDDGSSGELCLRGPAVGQGYYNDQKLTAGAFIIDPIAPIYRTVIYRTGDIVKYNQKDETIYILGRKDNQIKHMGYRIELEEIENSIVKLKYVNQAFCTQIFEKGISKIIAVISIQGDVNESIIREDINMHLPRYMIPAKFHMMSSLPTNPSGKIDRAKLRIEYS